MNDDRPERAQVPEDEDAQRWQARPPTDDIAQVLRRELLQDAQAGGSPSRTTMGTTVVSVAGDDRPSRRLARGGTAVAALAAGLVTLSGVAAASTLVPAGAPLHGLGSAVRSAAGTVLDAVTPPDAPPPAAPAARTGTERPAAVPGGAPGRPASGAPDPAATERSRAAARQVGALLDAASSALDRGRTGTAQDRLDRAERRLADVLVAERPPLAERLTALRARLDQARSAPAVQAPKGATSPGSAPQKAERTKKKKTAPAQQPAEQRPGASGTGKGKASKGGADLAPLTPVGVGAAPPAR